MPSLLEFVNDPLKIKIGKVLNKAVEKKSYIYQLQHPYDETNTEATETAVTKKVIAILSRFHEEMFRLPRHLTPCSSQLKNT